ncbi:MAG TPA: hypothetical protein VGV37_08705 [Aliidongia sp.]|uniref:hypothetical protein n=1 Tax=Aliidongia sp. TaxID=1914230 RepID=UPI002DDD4DA3|nr:hypothetical protein [Aliidongia sp.]HEV2674608.1 hypothetical protein [Aliidongia sp.]
MKDLRILIYVEDIPVGQNTVAHGLHRAAGPILKSVQGDVEKIAIYPTHAWFPRHDFDLDLVDSCLTLGLWATFLSKLSRRLPFLRRFLGTTVPLRSLAFRLRRSKADIILAIVGSSAETIERAALLSRLLGKPYALYLVDDFLLPLRLAGQAEAAIDLVRKSATRCLRGARRIFTITDGLGELITTEYGVASTTLHLAFEAQQRQQRPVKPQIFYLGSVNFLYADGLKALFVIIESLRRELRVDLTLRMTAQAGAARAILGELPDFVVAAPIPDGQMLGQELATSLFAYLPYSFASEHRQMISSSFPSKTLEYFAQARSIVVHGPVYGTSTEYFRKYELPTVTETLEDLERVVRDHLDVAPDHGALYAGALERNHSVAAAGNTIRSGLRLSLAE